MVEAGLARLAAVGSVAALLLGAVWAPSTGVAYLGLGLELALGLALVVGRPRRQILRRGLALVLLDTLAVSMLVGDTGGGDSPFLPLYFLAALGLALVGDTAGGVLGVAAVVVGYLAAVVLPASQAAPSALLAAGVLLSPGVALGAGLVAISCCVAGALGVRLGKERRANRELSGTLAVEGRHVREAEALVSRFGSALANLGLDSVLGWVAEAARELTDAEYAHAALLLEGHHRTATAGGLERYPTWWHPEVQRLTLWSCREDAVMRVRSPLSGMRELLAVPVSDGDERMGALVVGGEGFDAERERALLLLASGVAPALRDAREALGGRDTVTGLPNRASLYRAIERELSLGAPLAVLLLGLGEDLQRHNERYGFTSGDALLCRVGRRLDGSVRPAFYYGGGTFAVLLSGTDAARVDRVGRSLQRALADLALDPLAPLRAAVGHAAVKAGEAAEPGWIVHAARGALEGAQASPGRASSRALVPRSGRALEGGVESTAATAFLQAIEARSLDLADHSRAVASLARRVGWRMALSPAELDALTTGALLHDVGKIEFPDSILLGTRPLSAREYEIVKRHPETGARMLGADANLSAALPAVKHHHERFDGSGYPDGLKGKEIPLSARITHAVDAFDSMVRDRPYRRGMPHDAAMGELQRHAGTQFDPSVVRVILELFAEAERKATS